MIDESSGRCIIKCERLDDATICHLALFPLMALHTTTSYAVHTLESIQHTIFHSKLLLSPLSALLLLFMMGTCTPTGMLNKTSGVRAAPRSRNCASVSKGMPKSHDQNTHKSMNMRESQNKGVPESRRHARTQLVQFLFQDYFKFHSYQVSLLIGEWTIDRIMFHGSSHFHGQSGRWYWCIRRCGSCRLAVAIHLF